MGVRAAGKGGKWNCLGKKGWGNRGEQGKTGRQQVINDELEGLRIFSCNFEENRYNEFIK
jgi:hypothetical protein